MLPWLEFRRVLFRSGAPRPRVCRGGPAPRSPARGGRRARRPCRARSDPCPAGPGASRAAGGSWGQVRRRGVHHRGDRVDQAAPGFPLLLEAPAARRGQGVEPGPAVVVAGPPLAREEAPVLQAVARGVERPLLDLERRPGEVLDAEEDAVASTS